VFPTRNKFLTKLNICNEVERRYWVERNALNQYVFDHRVRWACLSQSHRGVVPVATSRRAKRCQGYLQINALLTTPCAITRNTRKGRRSASHSCRIELRSAPAKITILLIAPSSVVAANSDETIAPMGPQPVGALQPALLRVLELPQRQGLRYGPPRAKNRCFSCFRRSAVERDSLQSGQTFRVAGYLPNQHSVKRPQTGATLSPNVPELAALLRAANRF
jgi:hypothetical protein